MYKKYSCQQKGIGLLELMLSLAVIAILLVMATRYYMTAKQSQRTAEAVSMIKNTIGAASEYSIANGHTYEGMTLAALVSGGYLPASFCGSGSVTSGCGTRANPWNGGMSVSQTNPPARNAYNIIMDTLPTGVCSVMMDRINTSMKSNLVASPAKCAGNILTVLIQE